MVSLYRVESLSCPNVLISLTLVEGQVVMDQEFASLTCPIGRYELTFCVNSADRREAVKSSSLRLANATALFQLTIPVSKISTRS